MTGICAVRYNGGFAVTNEAMMDVEKHLIMQEDKKISKSTPVIKLSFIFDVRGKLCEGEKVECILKTEEGKKLAFAGVVKQRGKQVTVINELLKIDLYDQILTKLKQ